MADTKISALSSLTGASVDPAADVFPIVDSSATTTKKITAQELFNAASTLTTITGSSIDIAADTVPVYDNSATTEKKITVAEFKIAMAVGITLGTPQATTSGTTIDFSSIPSGTKRITINLVGVSLNSTASLAIQIGDSGGIETAGYSACSCGMDDTPANRVGASSACFPLVGVAGVLSGSTSDGRVVLELENSSNNTWVCSSTIYSSNINPTNGPAIAVSAGSKSTSATLDRVRLTTIAGTATFDSGEVNIAYE